MTSRPLGQQLVAILGSGATRDLLSALERPESGRAALIGRLSQREDAGWLAELLTEIETDPDDVTRLRLIGALRAMLGRPGA